MTVEVEFSLKRSVMISLCIDNVLATKLEFRTAAFPKKERDYYEVIKNFINSFMNLAEDKLYNISESYMPALNIHRNLKKVLTRSGKLIWSRT